tara:strand:+ start:279 stop:488 length:210 start_codon:yes stop_codon:yes gene_type:complete
MDDWLLFVIGLFVGSTLGVLLTALLSASKTEDLHMEIQDLRTQRALLKEELLKKQPSKLKPRKYRKKNV